MTEEEAVGGAMEAGGEAAACPFNEQQVQKAGHMARPGPLRGGPADHDAHRRTFACICMHLHHAPEARARSATLGFYF